MSPAGSYKMLDAVKWSNKRKLGVVWVVESSMKSDEAAGGMPIMCFVDHNKVPFRD